MNITKSEDSGIIVAKDHWGRKGEFFENGWQYVDVHTYHLQRNLPYNLKRGDEVSLSRQGYITKYQEGPLPFNSKMYTIGIFLGYYFIKNTAREKIDIRRRKFFKEWDANTKIPKGLIPMCKIIYSYGKNSCLIP